MRKSSAKQRYGLTDVLDDTARNHKVAAVVWEVQ
jgi:hypothetical protein